MTDTKKSDNTVLETEKKSHKKTSPAHKKSDDLKTEEKKLSRNAKRMISQTKKVEKRHEATPKKEIISKHQKHAKDTGSSFVQVAILTEKISSLTEHLKTHKKDNHSRRGLIGMVTKRKKLLGYIKTKSVEKYQDLIQKLGIRG